MLSERAIFADPYATSGIECAVNASEFSASYVAMDRPFRVGAAYAS